MRPEGKINFIQKDFESNVTKTGFVNKYFYLHTIDVLYMFLINYKGIVYIIKFPL